MPHQTMKILMMPFSELIFNVICGVKFQRRICFEILRLFIEYQNNAARMLRYRTIPWGYLFPAPDREKKA